ncbi:butyrophilin subfamily 2 member A2 isoform X2 [Pangasianodon hypophthalmus]|uniref:butyrophilin subfamily 2 member A2 isoform X2 n=1 Tax=Pangasianodon hypophthalmus TaxID=310915 RepID=UPI002306E9B6|nr:butyrophilin subfamily 2 member A2 isoform X2 [Pangasianodon hypophthalmus]
MIPALPLRWALLLLFPTLSHQTSGYFSVKVQSPVSGFLGSSVSLHCAVANNMDVRHLAVRWYRPKMSDTPVLFYKNTQIQKSPVDVQYQGRVFLLGELEKGDVSLKLENLTLADRGDYVCHVSSDDWYDEATVSLRVRVVGSSPVLSLNEAEGGKMNVSCQSHGWLPEPSITWTDKDGKDLKHLSKVKFTNNSEEFIDVSSWLIVSPSESEWISCSVGFSDQERKEGRIIPHTPTGDAESWKVCFTVTLILLFLCMMGSAVCFVRQRKVLIDLKRKRATENTLLTCETSGTPSERKHLYKNCVENEDKNEAPTADTDHHSVDGDLDQVKKFKVNITIDPNETPALLTHKGKEIKCSVPKQNWDRNNEDEKIFTLCKEKFNSGKHYWEVKVRESHKNVKLSWFVGVASDAAERIYNIPFTPQNEFWVLCYETEEGFYIRGQTELISLPDLNKELTAVGVFLDCDKHTLSFYNINTESHIYTFTNVEPKTALHPLISPGVRDIEPVWIL